MWIMWVGFINMNIEAFFNFFNQNNSTINFKKFKNSMTYLIKMLYKKII